MFPLYLYTYLGHKIIHAVYLSAPSNRMAMGLLLTLLFDSLRYSLEKAAPYPVLPTGPAVSEDGILVA
jgi:hypothetical protein